MSPHEPVHAFIDNYVKLLPESDLTEFQKVLEMKVAVRLLFFHTFCNHDRHKFSHRSVSQIYQQRLARVLLNQGK